MWLTLIAGDVLELPLSAGQPHGHPSFYVAPLPSCQACEAADCPGVSREAD